MIKYISEFSSLNLTEDWQLSFEQPECYAQPFARGDIIRVHALSTTGDGETAYFNVINTETGALHTVTSRNTGVRSGDWWIVEYDLSVLDLAEGLHEAYMMDKIGEDEYYVRDFNHNGNSRILFRIISDEAAKETVKLVYTDRENNFDTAFNDAETVYGQIERNERWNSNLITGGSHYAVPVTDLANVPVITPNVTNDPAALLGWSRDVVKGNVFIGGDYYEQASMNGLAFVVQYDGIRFFDSNNKEIIVPDGTNAGTLTLSASYKAGSQYFDDSAPNDIITGGGKLYALFIPPTKTISGVSYPVTYTDEYGAGASGWFFGLSMSLGGGTVADGTKVVFTNLLITPIPAAEYNELQPGELIGWSPALEEMPPESVYFDFRTEGGFLPSERTFAAESGDFRDQRYTPTQLSSRPYQKKTLSIGTRHGVPYWTGKKINQIFSCSFVEVNDTEHVRSENSEPEVIPVADLYPLMVYKIELEEKENYKTVMKYLKIQKDRIVVNRITTKIMNNNNNSATWLCDTAEGEGLVYLMMKSGVSGDKSKPYLLNYMLGETPYFSLTPVQNGFEMYNVGNRIIKFRGKYYILGHRNQGENYTIWETTDFVNVTQRTMPTNDVSRSFFQYNGYVFLSTEYNLWRTQDFNAWVIVYSFSYVQLACAANDKLFVGRSDRRLMYSVDNGDTWIQGQEMVPAGEPYTIPFTAADVIYFAGEYFMTSGYLGEKYGHIFRSADGIEWEDIKSVNYGLMGVIYDTEKLYAVGNGPALMSSDFVNFETFDAPFNNSDRRMWFQAKLFDGKNWVFWSSSFGMLFVFEGKIVPGE
jgi:hypothetical protein